jgi:hypothetical protein
MEGKARRILAVPMSAIMAGRDGDGLHHHADGAARNRADCGVVFRALPEAPGLIRGTARCSPWRCNRPNYVRMRAVCAGAVERPSP